MSYQFCNRCGAEINELTLLNKLTQKVDCPSCGNTEDVIYFSDSEALIELIEEISNLTDRVDTLEEEVRHLKPDL